MKKILVVLFAALSAVSCQIDQFIIGGMPAGINDFPYTLALRRNGVFACGAAAVQRFWAISAATCFGDGVNTPGQFELRGGSTNRDVGGFIFNVNLIVLSPLFNGRDFNIGLARVMDTTPIEGFNVQTIPVAPPCSTECCNTCSPTLTTSTGWGIDDSGAQPFSLRQITLNAVTLASCRTAWNTNLQNEWFCLGTDTTRGFCAGDVGNPAVTTVMGVRWLTGVVISTTCGTNMNPAMVVRLEDARIRNWITWVTGV